MFQIVFVFLALGTIHILSAEEEKKHTRNSRKRSLQFGYGLPFYEEPELSLPVAFNAIEEFHRGLPESWLPPWLQPHPFFTTYPIEYELEAPPQLPPLIQLVQHPAIRRIPDSNPVKMDDEVDTPPPPTPPPHVQSQGIQLGSGSLGVVSLGNGRFALGSGSLGYSAVAQPQNVQQQNGSVQQRPLLQVGVSVEIPKQHELFLPDQRFLREVIQIKRRSS